MSKTAVLKDRPADFVVRESLVVPLDGGQHGDQQYLVLRKSGFTTMEAIRIIAAKAGVSTRDVTYGGLKDEDGITEQLVALPPETLANWSDAGPWMYEEGMDRWLRLDHYGYGEQPLQIGRLQGNGFELVVRNLDPEQAGRLAERRKINLFFLNYHDVQRFGVPGGPKRTHEVGAAMLAGDWAGALRTLIALRAPESPLAEEWQGDAEAFFRDLDPRNASFYLASHASAGWNAALGELARNVGGAAVKVEIEGVAFEYLVSIDRILAVLADTRELARAKYTFDDGRIEEHSSPRPTVVQTVVTVSPAEPDDHREGRAKVGLNFFLPSGCYATAAVRQLLMLRWEETP